MSVTLLPSKAQRVAALKALLSGMDSAGSVGLADVGDLLRRSDALGLDAKVLQMKLTSYRLDEVRRQVATEDGDGLRAALSSAVEESLQSHFSDDAGEQQQWRASAAQTLLRRDRLQSQLRAVEALAIHHPALIATVEGLEKKVQALDQLLSAHARALTPLNEFRRSERDLLNPTERAAAWWFSARSDCDPFLEALAGKTDNPHTPKCLECLADLDRTRVVLKPPSHLTAEVAFDLDLGVLPKAVEQGYRKHAEACGACGDLLKASEAGDRAIQELDDLGGHNAQSSGPPMAARRRGDDDETLDEAKEYRVILRRRQGSWKLLIAPRGATTIASASLTLSSKRNALAPHAVAEGLEFELGESVEGVKAQLRFKLGGGGSSVERSFSL